VYLACSFLPFFSHLTLEAGTRFFNFSTFLAVFLSTHLFLQTRRETVEAYFYRQVLTVYSFPKNAKEPGENVIDGNYISAQLISLLFDIDIESVQEEWMAGSELKTFVTGLSGEYNEKLFAQEFLSQSQCEIAYDYEGSRFRFSFVDIDGEVKNFAFFGKE